MNSPFATYYLELMARIKAAVPAIKYINQDLGQLEEDTDRPSVSFPCVLIDFDDFQFTDESYNAQMGEGNVAIRLGHAPYSNGSSLSPDTVRVKALEYYELEHLLVKALQGWEGTEFGPMTRIAEGNEKREDKLRVRYIIFKVAYQDNSTIDTFQQADADFEFDSTEEIELPQV